MNSRAARILRNLENELLPRNSNRPRAFSVQPDLGLVQHENSKAIQSTSSGLQQDCPFQIGENPLNIPMNAPLDRAFMDFISTQSSQENSFAVLRFETPAPIQNIAQSRAKHGYVKVHLRCLRIDVDKPKSEWKQAWPFPATCVVNEQTVPLNQAQRYTNGKIAGRDHATDITPFLWNFKKTGKSRMNKVVLRRESCSAFSETSQFTLCAQEILVLSTEAIVASVVEANNNYWSEERVQSAEKGVDFGSVSYLEMSRKEVIELIADSDDLTVSSMKVSLRCPLSLKRIATPVKGKSCSHVQCFDLEAYIEYSRVSSVFDCCLCDKHMESPAMLIISPYIEHALATFKDCDEVEIDQEGRMTAVQKKFIYEASRSEGLECMIDQASEVIDLTVDQDEDNFSSENSTGLSNAFNSIDLTLQSDEESFQEDC